MEDAAIMNKLENRDRSGLDEIKSKYGRLILNVIRGVLKNPQDSAAQSRRQAALQYRRDTQFRLAHRA